MHQDRLVNTLLETTEPAKSSQELQEATHDCIYGSLGDCKYQTTGKGICSVNGQTDGLTVFRGVKGFLFIKQIEVQTNLKPDKKSLDKKCLTCHYGFPNYSNLPGFCKPNLVRVFSCCCIVEIRSGEGSLLPTSVKPRNLAWLYTTSSTESQAPIPGQLSRHYTGTGQSIAYTHDPAASGICETS